MKLRNQSIGVPNKNRRTIALLMATALMAGCSSPSAAPEATGTAATQNAVKVERVEKRSMGEPREQVADVSAAVRFDIVPQASGTIRSLLKRNGERVRQGDVIAVLEEGSAAIERARAEVALSSAEQALASSAAELASSRLQLMTNLARLEDQLKTQLRQDDEGAEESRRSLDIYKRQLDELDNGHPLAAAQAAVENAKLSLKATNLSLQQYEIKAPADGVLTDMLADAGTNVSPGAVFGVVQNADQVKIKAKLTEFTVAMVRNKRELTVVFEDEDGAKSKQAKVNDVAELPDANTNAYALELETNNADGSLKPGSRVRVQLTTPEEELAVAVPSLAIVRSGEETSLAVVGPGNKAELRKVKLGRINGTYQEILSGINVGDSLIVSGQYGLKNGQEVKIDGA